MARRGPEDGAVVLAQLQRTSVDRRGLGPADVPGFVLDHRELADLLDQGRRGTKVLGEPGLDPVAEQASAGLEDLLDEGVAAHLGDRLQERRGQAVVVGREASLRRRRDVVQVPGAPDAVADRLASDEAGRFELAEALKGAGPAHAQAGRQPVWPGGAALAELEEDGPPERVIGRVAVSMPIPVPVAVAVRTTRGWSMGAVGVAHGRKASIGRAHPPTAARPSASPSASLNSGAQGPGPAITYGDASTEA